MCCHAVVKLCPTLCYISEMCCHAVASAVSYSLQPYGLGPTWFLSTGILKARILEWVAMPSSRGSSQPRNRTQVSHIAGGFYTV